MTETHQAVKLEVENLVKVFGRRPRRALPLLEQGASNETIKQKTGQTVGVRGATFTVHEGETLVIMGLSGSGKSTLLRCLNRLHEPTAGRVLLDGRDICAAADGELRRIRQRHFGMVFQHFGLFPHRTVLQNVMFGLEIQKAEKPQARGKSLAALELVGLDRWAESYPGQLSGGMKQRVGLARALATDPDILLMDEPFSALDPLIRTVMQDELLDLQTKVEKTILFITHDLDEALKMGDRIILLKDGAMVQIGTPEEILASPADGYVEKFIENVDVTRVLTASDVMIGSFRTLHLKDGPKTALHLMKRVESPVAFVVDNNKRLQGRVHVDDVLAAARRGEKNLKAVLQWDESFVVHPDIAVRELIQLTRSVDFPIVVADDNRLVKGLLSKGSLLAGIAGRGLDNE